MDDFVSKELMSEEYKTLSMEDVCVLEGEELFPSGAATAAEDLGLGYESNFGC
jgi:hypothetical protein